MWAATQRQGASLQHSSEAGSTLDSNVAGEHDGGAQPSDQMQAVPFLGKSSLVHRHVKKRPQLENSLNALSPRV